MSEDVPVLSDDGIHCGNCPFLEPYGDEYDFTARCNYANVELMWHDYWIADCEGLVKGE